MCVLVFEAAYLKSIDLKASNWAIHKLCSLNLIVYPHREWEVKQRAGQRTFENIVIRFAINSCPSPTVMICESTVYKSTVVLLTYKRF